MSRLVATRRLVGALTVALATAALASPRVILFPAIGTTTSVTFSGRVLKHVASGGSSTLSKNLRRLASSNWEGASVELRFGGQAVTVTSGHDGDFEATVNAPKDAPFAVGRAEAEAAVKGADTGQAPVEIVSPEAPFFVVSDFDDTVAVTNVLDREQMVKAALLQDEVTQPAVEGMAAFYGCLRGDGAAPPAFDVVSGSPVQYSSRIAAFLGRNGFPFAGLNLRDLGPKTLKDYKQPVVRALLGRLPQPVVLVGDSGEHDPEVYAQIRSEFPGRVKAVYIRNAGRADDAARFKDMLLFAHPREAALDAVKRGLASPACVDRAFPAAKDAGVSLSPEKEKKP